MNTEPRVSRAAQEMLASPASTGQRHAQIVKLASSLIGTGLNPEAVLHQLRPGYADDLPDGEIRAAINWAVSHIPEKSPFHGRHPTAYQPGRMGSWLGEMGTQGATRGLPATPISRIKAFLDDFRCDESDLWDKSPIRLPDNFGLDAELLISALFHPSEKINVVSTFSTQKEKANPTGFGKTADRDVWLEDLAGNGPPESQAGGWIRPNPTDGKGVSDGNITEFRFLLVEFDKIPLAIQAAFLSRISLPISAIISSGGKSLHAWVRMEAKTLEEYRDLAGRIFAGLAPFGIDPANRNPSRMSRLPGVRRTIGAMGDSRQRLLYLNPKPEVRRIFE